MGDKGGKKDKQKAEKQTNEKHKQQDKQKAAKQPIKKAKLEFLRNQILTVIVKTIS